MQLSMRWIGETPHEFHRSKSVSTSIVVFCCYVGRDRQVVFFTNFEQDLIPNEPHHFQRFWGFSKSSPSRESYFLESFSSSVFFGWLPMSFGWKRWNLSHLLPLWIIAIVDDWLPMQLEILCHNLGHIFHSNQCVLYEEGVVILKWAKGIDFVNIRMAKTRQRDGRVIVRLFIPYLHQFPAINRVLIEISGILLIYAFDLWFSFRICFWLLIAIPCSGLPTFSWIISRQTLE